MKTRLALFGCFFIILGITFFCLQRFDYKIFSIATEHGQTNAARLNSREISGSRPLVIFSHGTNSHKEVFLPIAMTLAISDVDSLMIDSAILSTDEGIQRRVGEIAGIRTVSEKGYGPPTGIFALGHSDGGPPSLEYMTNATGSTDGVIILGSQLSAKIPGQVPVRGFVGGFDQIFPAADIINDFNQLIPAAEPVIVSWLSDHFTEQYDPILIAAISRLISGQHCSSWQIVLALLLFAAAAIFSLAAGVITGQPSRERFCYAWSVALFVWILLLTGSGHALLQMPVPAAMILFFLLGISAGYMPTGRHLQVFAVFFILMEINVVIGTSYFRENLAAALPWLPLFMLWYPVAWVCKVSLFATSLTHVIVPTALGGWQTAWIIITLLPLIFSQGLFTTFRRLLFPELQKPEISSSTKGSAIAESAGKGSGQKRLAIAMFILMLLLWGIRFAQGMIQGEILQAVAGNFLSTLLLPCCYLIYLVTRRK